MVFTITSQHSLKMTTSFQNRLTTEQLNPLHIWLFWCGAFLLMLLVFRTSLVTLVGTWYKVEEYSHGFFIPCISAYFIWLRRAELSLTSRFKESLAGLLIMTLGLVLFLFGILAAVRTIELYSFIIALTGLFAAAFGMRGLRIAAIPLIFLIFMVPFPPFIMNNLSSKLQLISSWLGVEFIRACHIMVFLEGNVIDLGTYKLQVVDACSGLRYLFPLSSLAFLCAFLFKGPVWQKILIFLSSMPLTIFMNSFRIGVIGVMVDNWGTEMAEGFLHDFEGWVVFLLCMALLFVEMWVFSRISGNNLAMRELVQIPDEWAKTPRTEVAANKLNKSVFVVLILLGIDLGAGEKFKDREDILPQRQAFLNFPMQIGTWKGRNEYLEPEFLNELKLTDYLVGNFVQPEHFGNINFYSAYYQTQRKGAVVHSPRSCMPGGGWQITQYEQLNFPELKLEGEILHLNRAIIQKGEEKQLVYFWFQQRGRVITDEFMVKWFLFTDSIAQSRTDGALVRLVTPVEKTEDISLADQRLQAFLKELLPLLPAYIPGKNIISAGTIKVGELNDSF